MKFSDGQVPAKQASSEQKSTLQSLRLDFSHALVLHAVACVLFVSGAIAAIPGLMELWEFDDLPEPSLKHWALRVHGAAAMLFLIIFGTLLPTHVSRAWNSRRNRISGSILLIAFAAMIVSGYGIYYFGAENIRFITIYTHLILGIIEPFLFVIHLLLGRRSRNKIAA